VIFKVVGKLSGGIPYDFNNILVAIMGYAEILKEGVIERPEIGILVFPEGNDVLQFGIGYTPEAPNHSQTDDFEQETPY